MAIVPLLYHPELITSHLTVSRSLPQSKHECAKLAVTSEVIEERDEEEEEEEEEEDNDWDELDEAFDRAAYDEEITMAAGSHQRHLLIMLQELRSNFNSGLKLSNYNGGLRFIFADVWTSSSPTHCLQWQLQECRAEIQNYTPFLVSSVVPMCVVGPGQHPDSAKQGPSHHTAAGLSQSPQLCKPPSAQHFQIHLFSITTKSTAAPDLSSANVLEFMLADLEEQKTDKDEVSWYTPQLVSLFPPPKTGSRSCMSKPLSAILHMPGPHPQLDPTFPHRRTASWHLLHQPLPPSPSGTVTTTNPAICKSLKITVRMWTYKALRHMVDDIVRRSMPCMISGIALHPIAISSSSRKDGSRCLHGMLNGNSIMAELADETNMAQGFS
ncbi:hypothetical protein EI94DRAFT_1841441 [Lactarius quietus]|nr:hypothetical protein EI94DRAFT_1841441 [Lactarius quietus]